MVLVKLLGYQETDSTPEAKEVEASHFTGVSFFRKLNPLKVALQDGYQQIFAHHSTSTTVAQNCSFDDIQLQEPVGS